LNCWVAHKLQSTRADNFVMS